MKRLFVFGIVFGIIPSVALGAEVDLQTYPFFNYLILMFAKIFKDIQANFFGQVKSIYISGTLTAMLTLVIFIYAFRKIKEATFEFPKDVIEVIIFLVMVAFVNYSLNNYANYIKLVNYLEIPADTLARIITKEVGKSLSINNTIQRDIGGKLEQMLTRIKETQQKMMGSSSANYFKVAFDVLIKFLLWLVYAWFAFILIASIAITYILTFLQVEFWKMFGVILIPLIYFKATRGMVIFWGKTIIALSLISAFMSIIAYLSVASEETILRTLGKSYQWEMEKGMGMSYSIIGAIIVSKLILITFLKEIPQMINGMLGTSAASGTGQFANSVAMGSIGAAGAGAGFATFKGAMKGGKLAGNTAKGLGATAKDAFMAQGGAANQLLENGSGSGSAGASGSKSSLGGNIKKGFSTVKNITQGKSAYSKNETPKTPPTPPKEN